MRSTVAYYGTPVNEAAEAAGPGRASKLLVLSNKGADSDTVPLIEAKAKRMGLECRVLDLDSYRVKPGKDDSFTVSDVDGGEFTVSPDDTAVLCRRGIVHNTRTRALVALLEDAGYFVVNTLASTDACENKYLTSKILLDAGLPVPRMALVPGDDYLEEGVKEVGGKFPVVVKLLSGSQGIGVSIVDSYESLRSVLQTLWKVDPTAEVLLQEKIDSDHDVRAHVLTRRFNAPRPDESDQVILGYMRRNRVDKDFRTNHSLGGSVEKVKLTKAQEELSLAAARAVGCNWCGVDIITDRKTGKDYLLEVNASPGTKGLKKATGIDVLKDVLEFVVDRSNWTRSRRTVGFREVVEIPGIGELVAKMDTGNGASSCSLTYDESEETADGKHVTWTLGGRKFKSAVVDHSMAEVGHKTYKRPVIELDVRFAGRLYRKVRVSLVDRTEKSTPFLANREFLVQTGCAVNPLKTFVATEFPDGYDAKESKGDKHAGIRFGKSQKD